MCEELILLFSKIFFEISAKFIRIKTFTLIYQFLPILSISHLTLGSARELTHCTKNKVFHFEIFSSSNLSEILEFQPFGFNCPSYFTFFF